MNAQESRKRIPAYTGDNFKSAVFGRGNPITMTNSIISGAIGGVQNLIGNLSGEQMKMAEESNWYGLVFGLIDSIC